MLKELKTGLWACGGCLLIATGAHAASITIDDFDTGPSFVDSTTPGPTNFAAAGAIGGSRTMEILGYPTDADPTSDGTTLEVAVPPGEAGMSENVFTPGGRSRITWDADGAGLGAVDLTDSGAENAINFEIVAIDVGSVDIKLTVESLAHGTASITSSTLGVGSETILYTDFAGYSSDIFKNVDSISMEITALTSTDLRMDLLETTSVMVPVPSAAYMGLTMLGSLGIVNRIRRRK